MRRHATLYVWAAAGLACATMGGCHHPNLWDLAKDFVGERPGALSDRAFMHTSADQRREGIVEMSHRWWGMDPTPLRGYALIASAPGESPTVRCVALRALARAGPDAAPHVDDIVAALSARSHHVRWDAALALDSVVDDKAVRSLASRSGWDPERRRGEPSPDVRMSCVRALRHYRRTDVVAVLAGALESDRDYVVRREAHESLVELVGVDRGWDGRHWQADTEKLLPLPRQKSWWNLFGLPEGDGDGVEIPPNP